MRHRHGNFELSRTASHRIAMFRNMSMALIRHERIITTEAKAKALRPFFEKLVTLARKGDLHSRRLVASKLGPSADAEVNPGSEADADHRTVLQKLFQDIGPRFKDRPGGYTRIVKRHQRRLGDAGVTAYIELLKEGEVRTKRERTAAPAPAPVPTPEAPEEKSETSQGGGEAQASGGEQSPAS
jgi:large subunit ribosomal protein L17